MAVATPAATERPPGLARLTAVVVDEAPHSGKALEDALRYARIEPVYFERPASARDYLTANPADLVLTNVHLPEEHGLGLADIRQLPLHETTPVIFGSELFLQDHPGEELSANAPRLDTDPLLLKQMALRALNELHSANRQAAPSKTQAAAAGESVPAVEPAQ